MELRVTSDRTGVLAAFCAAASLASIANVSASDFSRVEVYEYHDLTTSWVLGQPKKKLVDGVLESEIEYSPLGQPIRTKKFGAVEETRDYWPDGTLRSVADGRHTASFSTQTVFSDWKRGIPQNVAYPATPDQPGGTTNSASVSDDGQIEWVIDENGYQTCYSYDVMGRLSNIYPPSQAWTCDFGQADWNKTSLALERAPSAAYGLPAGHWRHVITTGNAATIVHFDALLRPVVEETYDYERQATTKSVVVTRYDAAGRLEFRSYPMRHVADYAAAASGVRTRYDALGRVVAVAEDSDGGAVHSTYTQYLPGLKTRVTNPRNVSTTFSFMAFDDPEQATPVLVEQAEGVTTHIFRDVFGKPNHIVRTDYQNLWDGRYFYYDAHQRLCREEALQEGSSARGYDAAGNLSWSAQGLPGTSGRTDCVHTPASTAAVRVDRSYDQRNRLKALTFAADQTGTGNGNQLWAYTPDGLPSQVRTQNVPAPGADPKETINTYIYNTRRLLTGESVTVVGPSWSVLPLTYGYDGNGHLAHHIYPTGHAVTYAPDALGRPTHVSSTTAGVTYASNIVHHPNGATASFQFGNGVPFSLSQNTKGMPQRVAHGSVVDNSYVYDSNGNMVFSEDHQRLASGHRWMAYDDLDRLEWAGSATFGQDHHLHFTYDILDNIRSWKSSEYGDPALPARVRNDTYCYDSRHRLTFLRTNTSSCSGGAARVAFAYDDRGNLASKNAANFAFDLGNRLREVSLPGAAKHSPPHVERYRYDAHGRRVLASRLGGGASSSLGMILSQYSLAGQLMFQQNFRPEIAKDTEYVYLNGTLLAQREVPQNGTPGAIKFQHTDPLGTPIAITNGAGGLIERMDYNPYGGTVAGTLKDAPGFTGHALDRLTGMNYMQQRYYDPGIGRFLSVDPVTADGNTGGNFNRYWYANNNPYKFTDPDGRLPILIPIAYAAYRVYSAYDTASSTVDNARTLGDSNSSTGDKIQAGAEIAGALVGGKIGRNAAGGAANIAKRVRDPNFKKDVWANNKASNGGQANCETCGKDVQPGTKLEKGDKVPGDRGDADHKQRLADGGADDAKTNGQLLCNDCHVDKTRLENMKK